MFNVEFIKCIVNVIDSCLEFTVNSSSIISLNEQYF